MLKFEGAFLPTERTSSSLGGCSHHAMISPPKRFVATQFSGGLKFLFQQLRNKKNDLIHDHEPGSQTSEDGRFQPSYPVPLLGKRYKFVQVIGRGQSSILISAEDCFHPDKKTVALKVMHLDYSRLGVQEAECIQQLNKVDGLRVSRMVQLLNKFTFDGHYCIVFELLRPRSLNQYFQSIRSSDFLVKLFVVLQRCQFDDEEAKLKVIRKIALQLLQALAFLKRENVIHADLKPENILLEEGEEIKVKVVDFGNAIRCIHREVSLYYDEFELQTLLYRAPEVMFGVPFGPEIDIWSLGCILAELYIGAPLFIGRNKKELLKELVSVLGPLPRNPFQTGKYFDEFCEFVGQFAEDKPLLVESNLMRKLHNTRNFLFASFLVGLLQYKPCERLTPWRAVLHTFLAPEVPNAYLLPLQGEKSPDSSRCYTNIFITAQQYQVKPHIDSGITRRHFSSRELLHRGTSESSNKDIKAASGSPVIGNVSFLAPRQIRHDDPRFVRLSSDAAGSANTEHSTASLKRQEPSDTRPAVNSRYAREGPLTIRTVSPRLDKKNRSGDIYDTKEEQSNFHRNLVERTKAASSTNISPFTRPKKEEDLKFNSSNKRLLEENSRVEEAVSGFSVETPNIGEVKLANQTYRSTEPKQNCNMKDRLSKDETIGAARTRVYFANVSKSQKLDTLHGHSQSSFEDLKNRFDRVEDRNNELCCSEESRPIGLSWTPKSTKHKKKEMKLHSIVPEQESSKETNTASSTYDEDGVMLL